MAKLSRLSELAINQPAEKTTTVNNVTTGPEGSTGFTLSARQMATVFPSDVVTSGPLTQEQHFTIHNVNDCPTTTANIHCEGTDCTSSTSELQICHLQHAPAYESLSNWQTKFIPMNNNRELDWNDCLMTDSGASLCVCPLNYRTECPLDTECQRPELHTATGD